MLYLRKHVFEDIRPYVCTFKNCRQSNHLFDNQHDWFEHEQEVHRREWFCSPCNKVLDTHASFLEHVEGAHPGLQTILERCERPIQSRQACPFCGDICLPRHLQKHLGYHMQSIAIFVLKPFEGDDGEDDPSWLLFDEEDASSSDKGEHTSVQSVAGSKSQQKAVKYTTDADRQTVSRGSSPTTGYQALIPSCRNKSFSGRENIIQKIEELSSTIWHGRIALCGLGGVGYELFLSGPVP